jgi:MFS family permease
MRLANIVKDSWQTRWTYVLVSSDCAAGVLVALTVYVATVEVPKLRETHLFDVTAGVGVAILAVVIAAFAILAAFLTDEYSLVIKETLGDARRAFEPYAVVALVSGAAVFVSVAGIFVWPVAPGWTQSLIMAFACGLSTWAIVGSVQLVGITATHGRHRARVPEIRAAYMKTRAERQTAEQEKAGKNAERGGRAG